MFVERNVCYSALFTNLVGWHVGAVSFPLSYVTLAQLACPLSDIMFCLHSEITNLSLYKHWIPHFVRIMSSTLYMAQTPTKGLLYFRKERQSDGKWEYGKLSSLAASRIG